MKGIAEGSFPRVFPAASLKQVVASARRAAFLRGFPRVFPAASLKRGITAVGSDLWIAFSAGIPRGLIEARCSSTLTRTRVGRFSAGIPRGLIEARRGANPSPGAMPLFSAGIPRGLIEATRCRACLAPDSSRFPRVFPAASLKPHHPAQSAAGARRFPRVFPAASLKRHGESVARGFSEVFRGYSPRPH